MFASKDSLMYFYKNLIENIRLILTTVQYFIAGDMGVSNSFMVVSNDSC